MRITHFHIKNFKGIADIRLNLNDTPRSKVSTLVGLNESGKTTILEALNFLSYKSETLDPLNLPGYSIKDVHDLIPIGKRANFNDSIIIEAGYELTGSDEEEISQLLLDEFDIRLTQNIRPFFIHQAYKFENSKFRPAQNKNTCSLELIGRKRKSRTDQTIKDIPWDRAAKFIVERLPSILFFPNFLFEFPDKIYLEGGTGNPSSHQFYRTVLQDILDSIDGGIDLKTHILERAKEDNSNSRRAIESVLLKMGSHITKTVFHNWDRIFKRNPGKKEIQVSLCQGLNNHWCLQLRVRDADELYSISERSLGFRWFFAFLLLTQYRGFRQNEARNILFLLDEPASNLHSSAQSQLLESFGKFPENCSIIYTTHSHHMINPEWLESCYVVKNEGLDYESSDDYATHNTRITLTKYREFATKHPNQTTYFQPILDVLDFKPGRLENVPNVIMTEGKNDFYILKYFMEKIIKSAKKLHVMPGSGSGSLDTCIRLYLAWGKRFIVLLDSDTEGTKQKTRYRDLFGPSVANSIFTLADIDSKWKNLAMESLLSTTDQILIQSTAYPNTATFNKTHFNRAIQELYLTSNTLPTTSETKGNFEKIMTFSEKVLGL